MSHDEPNNQTWQFTLSDADQQLINDIKIKVASSDRKPFPPTPPAEIEAAEAALSFAFPALIRELWVQVGNGGFGPGGITGVETGQQIYGEHLIKATLLSRTIEDHLLEWVEDEEKVTPQTEKDRQRIESTRKVYEQWYWKDTFIMYCSWGCTFVTVVDCGDPDLPIHALDSFDIKSHSSKTLRQFWQDWLDGTVQQS